MNNGLAANSTLSHYRIVAKLGAGGMGEVWLAEDTRLDRKVALKLLPAEFTQNSERLRRFTQEAKAASALSHPNIISVYDIGECETGPFIVMELVSGRTLRSVIASDNSLETVFALGSQMVRALVAAHAAGITHRDIKPDNIMVRDDGYVKVLDFGLARLLPTTASDPEAATLARQTAPGTVMGTLAYMSPEQASGHHAGSPSDVFSLGIVLYELATGCHPFKSETMIGYLHALTSQVPPPMTSLKSQLPAALDDLILRMLAKDAARRPTAPEVAQALQEIEKYGTSNTLPIRTVADKPKATREDEGFWIGILPFKVRDDDPDVATLAEGLSEVIVTSLSRFRYLSVVTSASVAGPKGETGDERALGAKLGARYRLQGSIRKGGSAVRVTAQLVDTETGAQLWSETYNRDLQTSTIFAVQDDVAGRIVATVADSYGVLVHSMRAAIRKKDDLDLTPVEWQFQYFAYREQITPAAHAALKSRLQRVAERNVGQSDLWAALAQIYVDEYAFGFQGDETSLDRALAAGRRAVELDRANQFALVALAQVHFFRQDLAAFGPAAERAMSLNPLNTDALGILGLQIVHTGQFERGTAIVRRAMELNPNHAGWMHFAPLWDHFHKGEYEQALECANRVDVPGLFWPFLVMASACGHLGRRAEAEAAVRDLLALDPEFAAHARSNVGSWHFASGLMDPILEGLRQAGLAIPATDDSLDSPQLNGTIKGKTKQAKSGTDAGAARTGEGFRVAVLPFRYSGSNADLTALAEGLTEEIVTGLSRFSYLKVISRSSTSRYANESTDVRSAGKQLGARYVMEGSLRLAGSTLRVSVQLVDTSTGAHLWAETYNRQFSAEEIFALQDDLVPRIVSTVADINGVLPRSMSEAVCSRSPDALTPYEAVLRSFRYYDRVSPDELAAARTCLELAVEKAPTYADAWAMLALLCVQDYAQGFNLQSDSLTCGIMAAQHAVEAGPANHLAYFSLAQARFFQNELQSFRNAAERAVELNPMDGNSVAFMGELLAYAGDWERGLALASRAKQINPNHPGWFWYADFFHAYRRGDYDGALNLILKANLLGHWGMHAGIAASAGQLGDHEAAGKAVRDLLKLRPDFCATAHNELRKWFDPELRERLIDGLRKAGLEIADDKSSSSRLSPETSPTNSLGSLLKSIAVLPFQNLSVDPEQEFFADGITEEILNALAQIKELRVAGRSSSFSFKGRNEDLRSVGAKLNVTTILEGTLRRSGDRLRITAQLIDAVSGYQVWSERYDREMKDIFDVQDEITLAVVEALKVKLFGREQAAVLKRHTRNVEAHEFYLRGLSYFMKWTPEFFQKAIKSFDQAIAIDPRYASAYAGLAECYTEMSFFAAAREWMPKAREAARQALELDDTLGEAHKSLGVILMYYDRDYAGAEHEFTRAIALDPGSAHIHNWYGWYLGLMGRFDESSKEMKRAQELDPLSALIDFGVGAIFHWSRKPEQAIEHYQRVLELNPNFRIAYWFLADAYVEKGDFVSAIATIENAPIALNDPVTLSAAGHAYGKAGERRKALEILGELERQSSQEYEPAFHIAQVYLGLGEHEQALAWLEKACDERSVWLIWLGVDPKFDPLRSEPRFKVMLKQMNLPE